VTVLLVLLALTATAGEVCPDAGLFVVPQTAQPWFVQQAGVLQLCGVDTSVPFTVQWSFEVFQPQLIGEKMPVPDTIFAAQSTRITAAFDAGGIYQIHALLRRADVLYYATGMVAVIDCALFPQPAPGVPVTINVAAQPVVVFHPVVFSACLDPLQFAHASQLDPLRFQWSFGDGSMSAATRAEQLAVALYWDPGEYNVSLTVTSVASDFSWQGSLLLSVIAPVTNPTSCHQGLSYAYPLLAHDASFIAACGPAIAVSSDHRHPPIYQWSFGDGTPVSRSTDTFQSHTYLTPGVFNLDLVVQPFNQTASYFSSLAAVMDCPPSSSLAATTILISVLGAATSGMAVPAAAFPAEQSLVMQLCASDRDPLFFEAGYRFRWVFGDGAATAPTTKALVVMHRYALPGTYSISCQVDQQDHILHTYSGSVAITVPWATSTLPTASSSPVASTATNSNGTSSPWRDLGIFIGVLALILLLTVVVVIVLMVLHQRGYLTWFTRSGSSSQHERLLTDPEEPALPR
jgi:PKD repeat protein